MEMIGLKIACASGTPTVRCGAAGSGEAFRQVQDGPAAKLHARLGGRPELGPVVIPAQLRYTAVQQDDLKQQLEAA